MTVAPRQSVFGWLSLAILAAAAATLLPFTAPLVLAVWTANLVRPVLARVERSLRGRRRAAAVLTLSLVVGVGAPIGLLAAAVVNGAQELSALIARSAGARAALEAIVSGGGAPRSWALSPQELAEVFERHGVAAFQLLGGVAGAAVKIAVGAVVYFFGAYSFLVDGDAAWGWLERSAPLRQSQLRRLSGAFLETGRGLFVGVGLTSLSQAVVATLAYLVLGVPRALVLGLLTGLASFVPIVGTALVWAPVAVGLALTGSLGRALALALLGLIVISGVDNVLRPVFYRYGRLELPVFLLFVSVVGGVALLGPFGALFGPLALRLAKEVLSVLREEREAAAAPPPA